MTKKPASKPAKKPAKAKKPKAAAKQSAPREKTLTVQQRLFVLEYLKDFNATKAAIRAGYSEKTASQQAYQLLQIPLLRDAIDKEIEDRADRLQVDADWVLKRLKQEVEADVVEIFDDNGALKPISQWPRIWRQGLVAGIEVVTINAGDDEPVDVHLEPQAHGGELKRAKKPNAQLAKIKLSDRLKRLELIGRHVDIQAWKDKKEHSADGTLQELVRQIQGQSIRPKEAR